MNSKNLNNPTEIWLTMNGHSLRQPLTSFLILFIPHATHDFTKYQLNKPSDIIYEAHKL